MDETTHLFLLMVQAGAIERKMADSESPSAVLLLAEAAKAWQETPSRPSTPYAIYDAVQSFLNYACWTRRAVGTRPPWPFWMKPPEESTDDRA